MLLAGSGRPRPWPGALLVVGATGAVVVSLVRCRVCVHPMHATHGSQLQCCYCSGSCIAVRGASSPRLRMAPCSSEVSEVKAGSACPVKGFLEAVNGAGF